MGRKILNPEGSSGLPRSQSILEMIFSYSFITFTLSLTNITTKTKEYQHNIPETHTAGIQYNVSISDYLVTGAVA